MLPACAAADRLPFAILHRKEALIVKPTEFTRQVLLDQATNVFAEKGYDGASVREITRRADTNQASINYHFGAKASLYLEVLKLAVSAIGNASLLDADTVEQVPREEAVRLFIRQQVTPLLKHGQVSRYLRIFAWETLNPTPIYRDFIATEKLPIMDLAERIVRRFLPTTASPAQIVVATIWLTQQVAPFVRHFDALSRPPLNMKVDRHFIDELASDLCKMTVAGLESREKQD